MKSTIGEKLVAGDAVAFRLLRFSPRLGSHAVAVAIVAAWMLASSATAQQRAIDTEKSTLTVRVFKSGLLSAFGHDHEIAAPVAGGLADETAHKVELRVKANAMKVQDPGISDKDRGEIQSNMLGAEVLDAERFPEIEYKSTTVDPAGQGAWSVHGMLKLHGQTQPVDFEVHQQGGRYTGAAKLKLSAFGIKQVKAAGGAVKVKDEVRIEFDIQLGAK